MSGVILGVSIKLVGQGMREGGSGDEVRMDGRMIGGNERQGRESGDNMGYTSTIVSASSVISTLPHQLCLHRHRAQTCVLIVTGAAYKEYPPVGDGSYLHGVVGLLQVMTDGVHSVLSVLQVLLVELLVLHDNVLQFLHLTTAVVV